ncbi:MAG: prolyl oligopeptidase family serine peptidase [Bacteroidetes bacterium]|nr:prolyl oligopeptidase family serine peptidase [Bacteroidota bacterium]
MKHTILFIFLYCYSLKAISQINYPYSKTVDSSDTYFGINYPDPYRWLEKMKDPEVETWFKSQSTLTNEVIGKIPGREELATEWQNLSKLKKTSYAERRIANGRIFYFKTAQGESYPKLYFKETESATEQMLFDPVIDVPGKTVTLQGSVPSHDGKKVVLTYMENGSEISTLRILDVTTKQFLSENIYPCLGGGIFWLQDDKAFIYTLLATNDNTSKDFLKNNKVKLHIVGQDYKKDNDYLSCESYPELNIKSFNFASGELSDLSPQYLFSSIGNDDGLHIKYVASIKEQYNKHINWKVLSKAEDQLIKVTEFIGNNVYSITNKNAPNCKLIATNIDHPNWQKPELIAAERKDMVLGDFNVCKDFILLTYSEGVNCRLYKYDFKTKITTEVKLPYASNFDAWCTDRKSNTCYVKLRSWHKTATEYKLNALTNTFELSEFNAPSNYGDLFNDLEVEENEVKGHDGVMIPLSIIYKKGMKKDGSNFCLMDSYGSYGYSMLPYFDLFHNSLATKGFVIAIPHVRGGGEKGEAWRVGGLKINKPNTWKDFNCCAEYLISQGHTSSKKIIATSGSAGGIMISRAMTERPDLYGAAICISGIVNALRLEQMPNGLNCSFEFGKTKDSIECIGLSEMDGVSHVLRNKDYPALVCVTGINDPRVSPWQSAKLVAAFQQRNPNGKPALLMVNYENGHFNSSEDFANQIAFALWQCGHPDFQPKK